MDRKLFRSKKNRILGGVCGGFGEYLQIDPVVVRLLFLISLIPLHVLSVLAYLVCWIVLPRETETAGQTIESSPAPSSSKALPITVSIIFAVIFIFAGVLILFPGLFTLSLRSLPFVGGIALILVGAIWLFSLIREKTDSLLPVMLAIVLATFGVFFTLSYFGLAQWGTYIEYFKNLVGAVLLIAGLRMITRSLPLKLPVFILSAVVLIGVGVFSYFRGNYDPFGNFRPHGMTRLIKNLGTISNRDFSFSLARPDGVTQTRYHIRSSAGELSIRPSEHFILWKGHGLAPEWTANRENTEWSLDFLHQAGETDLEYDSLLPSEMSLSVTAGHLIVEASEAMTSLSLTNQVGSTELTLPRNRAIELKIEKNLADVSIPQGFKEGTNGLWTLSGNTGTPIRINIYASMGNVDIRIK